MERGAMEVKGDRCAGLKQRKMLVSRLGCQHLSSFMPPTPSQHRLEVDCLERMPLGGHCPPQTSPGSKYFFLSDTKKHLNIITNSGILL